MPISSCTHTADIRDAATAQRLMPVIMIAEQPTLVSSANAHCNGLEGLSRASAFTNAPSEQLFFIRTRYTQRLFHKFSASRSSHAYKQAMALVPVPQGDWS